MSFYRIQDREIPVEQLLDPELQTSESYCSGAVQHGKSVCRSIEELAEYFAQAGVPLHPTRSVLIELDGDWSDEEDEDAHLGAHLVIPTRIIAVGDIPDEFYTAVDAFFDAA